MFNKITELKILLFIISLIIMNCQEITSSETGSFYDPNPSIDSSQFSQCVITSKEGYCSGDFCSHLSKVLVLNHSRSVEVDDITFENYKVGNVYTPCIIKD